MSSDHPEIEVSNDELFTIRDGMRSLNVMAGRLQDGELEKIVFLHRNTMVAVLLSLEQYAVLMEGENYDE